MYTPRAVLLRSSCNFCVPLFYPVSQKRPSFYFLTKPIFTVFVVLKLGKFGMKIPQICPPHLSDVAALPWEIPKSNFLTLLFIIILQIICVTSEENKLPHTQYLAVQIIGSTKQ